MTDLQELPGFALVVGPDLAILRASEAADEFMAGRSLIDATDRSSSEKLRSGVGRAARGERLTGWEATLYDDDGDHVFLFDLGPAEGGVLVTGCDVSEMVRAASAAGVAAISLDDAFERARSLIVELSARDEEARQALVTALHDDAIQPLVAAQMRLGSAAPEAAEQLGAAVERLRRIVEATRPFPLTEGRLWPAVRDLAHRYDSSLDDSDAEEFGEPDASVIYRAAERFLDQLSPGASISPVKGGFDIRARDTRGTPSRSFLRREHDIMEALGGSVVELPGEWQVRLRRLSGEQSQEPRDRATMEPAGGGIG